MKEKLDIEQLRYLLAKLFGESLSPLELEAITGKPEPYQPLQQPTKNADAPVRFPALKEKLEGSINDNRSEQS